MPWRRIVADSLVVCAGCKFFRPLSPAAGECRRGPPLVVLGVAGWIVVGADELGCGEFIGVQQRLGDNPGAPP